MRRHCSADTVSFWRHQQIRECRVTNITTDVTTKTNTALRRTNVRMIMPVDGRSTAIIHIREQPQLTLRSLSLRIKKMHLAAENHPKYNSSSLWSNKWHSRRKRHPWKGVLLQCRREASRRSCLATAVSVRPVCSCAWLRITLIPAVMPFPSPLSRWILAGRSSGFSLHKHQLLCSVSRLVMKISWWILCKRIWLISP